MLTLKTDASLACYAGSGFQKIFEIGQSIEPMSSTSTEKKTPKTLIERQPYLLAYGAGISLFSPAASLYQLIKLNPHVSVSRASGAKMALRIFPQQTFLKWSQMNASTPVKDYFNPWAAFALVGVLQGGVYGQANINFTNALKLGKEVSYMGLFRGYGFAGLRDMLSQGIPYVFSKTVEREVADRLIDTTNDPDGVTAQVKRWASVFGTSIFATYASQGFHNCQIAMHADHSLNHLTAIRGAYEKYGLSILYRGGEARVGLLLVVNVLNELFLKKAWE